MRPVNCTCGQVGLIAYTKFPWKKKKSVQLYCHYSLYKCIYAQLFSAVKKRLKWKSSNESNEGHLLFLGCIAKNLSQKSSRLPSVLSETLDINGSRLLVK